MRRTLTAQGAHMSDMDVIIQQEGAVRTLLLNRPASRNGLTPNVCERLAAAIEEAGTDATVRCIVLTGKGTSFCSGADLTGALSELGERSHDDIIRDCFHRLIRAVIHAPKPVLASIRGGAVGFGFDLALACDLRVASRVSKMGAVFGRIGLIPDGGSSFTLSRLVGLGRAMELVLLAETFDGERAYELGIVNRIVNDDELESTTHALAHRLASGPPLAHKHAKANFHAGLTASLDETLEREVAGQVECLASADAMEGVQAFLGKRKPQFKGH